MKYRGSIKNRLIAIIMLVTTLTGIIGYGSFLYWYMGNQYDRALNLSQTLGLVMGQDIAKLVLLNDVSAAADISSQLKSFSSLNSMVLYKKDGKAILQYSKDNKSFVTERLPEAKNRISNIQDNNLKLYIDAKYQNTHLGFVQLNFNIETIYDVILRDLKILIVIFLFVFILAYPLSSYFAKVFTNPILKLVKFLEKIEMDETLRQRISTMEQNEYGKLYDEVNTMLERIETSHEALKIAAVAFETQSGITITDKEHNILQVNKAFTDITGYQPEEVIGQNPRVLKSGLHEKNYYDEMFNTLRKHNFWMGEINNRHKDGSIVNEHLTIYSILDDNGEVKYYVASFIDITVQKEAEAKLKEKESMLVQQSKMAAMGEMLENIAHQWRQPLSAISTISTGLVVQKEIGGDIDRRNEINELTRINDTAQYLSRTINDFREFFKTSKETNDFNLKESYIRTLHLINAKLKSSDIMIIEELNDVTLNNLENELIQVIMNIINNAKDALLESNIKKKLLFVKIYTENNQAMLSIKDNAGGIDEAIIEKVFEPYFTTKHQAMGTGIGLYMSKEMVNKHLKGSISVKNETFTYENHNYKGACFTITLPLTTH